MAESRLPLHRARSAAPRRIAAFSPDRAASSPMSSCPACCTWRWRQARIPSARIAAIDAAAAMKLPGVRAVVTGDEIASATEPMMSGLDLPKMLRWPLAVGHARYAGEWVAAVVAEIARASRGRGRAFGHCLRGAAGGGRSRGGDRSRRAARPSRARLEPALSPQIRVGAGRTGFRRGAAPHLLSRALAPERHRADRDVRHSRALGFLGAAHGNLGIGADAEICRPSWRARCAFPAMVCASITTSTWAAPMAASAD